MTINNGVLQVQLVAPSITFTVRICQTVSVHLFVTWSVVLVGDGVSSARHDDERPERPRGGHV